MGTVLDGDLRPLLGLRRLRRLRLIGLFGEQEAELRKRLPEASIEVVHIARTPGPPSDVVGPVEVTALPNAGGWTIFADLAASLGVSNNLEADAKIRAAIAEQRPELLSRLEFDPEPERLSIFGEVEADVRAAAELLAGLIEQTAPPL
jgi:hypothetical protein